MLLPEDRPYPSISYCLCFLCLLIVNDGYAQKRMVRIDSTEIWLNTIGIEDRKEGQAIIVFESGYGTPMDHWDKVLAGVSAMAPVLTYERPGIGQSKAINEMPTVKNVADRLCHSARWW